jgi:hypothetical protein
MAPDHDALAPMMTALIEAMLAGDTFTSIQIAKELEAMGATVNGVANTTAVMAAALLSEAYGGKANARNAVRAKAAKVTTREAKRALAA